MLSFCMASCSSAIAQVQALPCLGGADSGAASVLWAGGLGSIMPSISTYNSLSFWQKESSVCRLSPPERLRAWQRRHLIKEKWVIAVNGGESGSENSLDLSLTHILGIQTVPLNVPGAIPLPFTQGLWKAASDPHRLLTMLFTALAIDLISLPLINRSTCLWQ